MHLYPQCIELVIEKPQKFICYIDRRTLIPILSFWAREKTLYQSADSIRSLFPDNFSFKNPDLEIENILLARRKSNAFMLEYKDDFSDEMEISVFERVDQGHKSLSYGSYAGINEFVFKYMDINNFDQDVKDLAEFSDVLQAKMAKNYVTFEEHIRNKIAIWIFYMNYAAISYFTVLILIFFIYYLPFLNHEIKILDQLQSTIDIIPRKIAYNPKINSY